MYTFWNHKINAKALIFIVNNDFLSKIKEQRMVFRSFSEVAKMIFKERKAMGINV